MLSFNERLMEDIEMNIAVCEDEENIRNFLLGSLKEELRCRRLYANVQTYESGEALLEAMKHMTFEIIS